MSTTLTIGGSGVSMPSIVIAARLTPVIKDGIPSFTFQTRGGPLVGLPDPYLGKSCVVAISGTTYFTGDVTRADVQFDEHLGWLVNYTAFGLQYRAKLFAFTDANTGTDTAGFNLQPEDPDYLAARAGRTVGQIITACLTMAVNATALDAAGIGGYTSLSPPTLPASTVSDLAALTVIPPTPVYVQGEKFLGALEAFLQTWAPNHTIFIEPTTGKLRFLDTRAFTAATLTLGTDPIEPPSFSRDTTDCFQKVVIRGQPYTVPQLVSTSNGGLIPHFEHDGLNNAEAEAAWTTADFDTPGSPTSNAQATAHAVRTANTVTSVVMDNTGYGYAPSSTTIAVSFTGGGGTGATAHGVTNSTGNLTSIVVDTVGSGYTSDPSVVIAVPGNSHNSDSGTCTCPSTLTVTVTSVDIHATWPSNYWDQTSTGRHGVVYLSYSSGAGLTQYTSRRVVSNTALTAGGTSTLTLDIALPITDYDSYVIDGTLGGAANVWRLYTITNATVAAALARQFTYPVAYTFAGGSAITLTSYPMGSVLWSLSGNPPYNEVPLAFITDPTSGTILFARPTWEMANNAPPADVRALLAVNTGALSATKPASSYEGTSFTVEGLTRTLTVTVSAWRDPANQAGMADFAQDLLDSVKDTVVEGTVVYYGLYTPGLTMGAALNITGTGYTTGWEATSSLSSFSDKGLPIVECTLDWPMGRGLNYITTMHVSNRRAHYTAANFLRPSRMTGLTFGMVSGTFMGGFAGAVQQSGLQTELTQSAMGGINQVGAGIASAVGGIGAGIAGAVSGISQGIAGAVGGLNQGISSTLGALNAGVGGTPTGMTGGVGGTAMGAGTRIGTGQAPVWDEENKKFVSGVDAADLPKSIPAADAIRILNKGMSLKELKRRLGESD